MNKSQDIKIEKLVLNIAGTEEKLKRGVKLLSIITGKKPLVLKSKRRIPTWGVRPGLEVGCKVTLRKEIIPVLKRLLQAINNEIKEKQIAENHFSFGIAEYIEIPGMEYQREIGVLGLNVTVDFIRIGKRVMRKKIKTGKIPKRQNVNKQEIKEYLQKNLNIKFKEKK